MRLGAVLEHLQAVGVGCCDDGVHLCRLAVEITTSMTTIVHASVAPPAVNVGRVQGVRARVDLAEDGSRAGGDHRGHGWHARVRDDEHLVARLDAKCQQADPQRVGA